MQTLADLDAAIEAISQYSQKEMDQATDLVSALSNGEGLIDRISDVDLRVAGLLRIAAINHYILYEHPERRQLIELITERFSERGLSIAKSYGIDRNSQADEICRRLGRIADNAQGRLIEATESYGGVAKLGPFRQRLLQALNDDRSQAAIRPFIIRDGHVDKRLREALDAAVAYSTANLHQAKLTFEIALSQMREAIEAISEDPSTAIEPVVEILKTILVDLGKHFERSPLSKPAHISLRASARRHPLRIPDLELSIPIELRNDSEGSALDLQVELNDAVGLRSTADSVRLSSMNPGIIVVEFLAQTDPSALEGLESAICTFSLSWTNADGTTGENVVDAELEVQDASVDWTELNFTNPYSLEAVEDEDQLVGRAGLLDRMTRVLATKSAGSFYIHGQKRVGKTSLAHVALKRVERQLRAKCIYLETGEITNADASIAVDNLARELISRLPARTPRKSDFGDISYDGSLRPLISRLKSIADPDKPIVIAIDEFDRLPALLYRHSDEGDAFFTGLRSIASTRGVGLILIGGERMRLIINGPGVELNKFNAFPIDYLDRATQWGEFQELVRNPTDRYLEFTEEACTAIYDATSGNPYYTKQLCGKILELATERRDAFVDVRDVELAYARLLNEIDSASFSHYWEDHVLDHSEKRDQVTLDRRRCLLALGLAWSTGEAVTTETASREALDLGLSYSAMEHELQVFKDRGFLVDTDGVWTPRVEMFGKWIRQRGPSEIVVSDPELTDLNSVVELHAANQVTAQEADDLAEKLGPYRGKALTGQRILEYLRQFGDYSNQRLILRYLKSIYFVTSTDEDALLREAYRSLQGRLKQEHQSWQQSQLALSYVGGPGKSSAATARAFLKANVKSFTRREEVAEPNNLECLVDNGVTDIVILDDFVGTGDTLRHGLEALQPRIPESMTLHVIVLVAMSDGLQTVSTAARQFFGDRCVVDGVHSIDSFSNPVDALLPMYDGREDAHAAEKLIRQFGTKLESRIPLGYGKCFASVVFSHSIPNNAPAILWSASSGELEFAPLFPRNV